MRTRIPSVGAGLVSAREARPSRADAETVGGKPRPYIQKDDLVGPELALSPIFFANPSHCQESSP